MIPLELVLFLLDGLRAEGIAMIESPRGRDGFALGEVHGWMAAIAKFREQFNEAVEQSDRNSEREDYSEEDDSGQEDF